MAFTSTHLKVFSLASAAAILAACGEGMNNERSRAQDADGAGETGAASVKPARATLAPGDWHYKESDGYPWAGFGPPRSEALFAMSCQRGEIVFQRTGRLDDGVMTIITESDKGLVEMRDPEGEFPMIEGRLPANSPFVNTLLTTTSRFTVDAGDQTMTLPPDSSYRRVIRACLNP